MTLYDWDTWFQEEDGFVLQHGKDYTCSQSTMVQQIRNVATQRGIKVAIVDKNDRLVVTIVTRSIKCL